MADGTRRAGEGKRRAGVGVLGGPLDGGVGDVVRGSAGGAAPAGGAEAAHRSTVVGVAAARATVSGDEVAIAAEDLELR